MLQDQLATIGKAENEFEDEIGRERRVDRTIIECRAKNKRQQPGWLIAQFAVRVSLLRSSKKCDIAFLQETGLLQLKEGGKEGGKEEGEVGNNRINE